MMPNVNKDIALRLLKAMPARDREVLIRFYSKEQSAQGIQAEMDLTESEFQQIKSRAQRRFQELVRNRSGQ